VAPNLTVSEANTTMNAFVQFAQNATSGQVFSSFQAYDSFYAYYLENNKPTNPAVGINVELGSRLISKELAQDNPEKIADIMLATAGNEGRLGINFVAGGAVSRADAESTGLNPNWRKSVAHIYFGQVWDEGTAASVIQALRQKTRQGLDILDGLSVGSVTYFNEASLYERDFKKTFFGPHYGRLRAIKSTYDPHALFIVASGVGSEDWDGDLNCRV